MSTTISKAPSPNPIDRAIDYCVSYDPYFLSKTQGATLEQIASLEKLIGRPSSEVHRRFLERLGVSQGWLDWGAFNPSIDALISAYQRTRGTIPDGYEMFAVATDLPFEDAYLVAERGNPDLIVASYNSRIGCDFSNLAGDLGTSMAGSLPQLICNQPLARFQAKLAQLAYYGCLDPSASLLAQFTKVTAGLGLTPMWFSNARAVAMSDDSGETLSLAQLAPDQSLLVSVASNNATMFGALGSAMLNGLKLEETTVPEPPPPPWPPTAPAPAG